MYGLGLKVEEAVFAYVEYTLVLGVIFGKLDKGIADHDMIVLV